jgi:hypothetical protein
MKVPSYSSHLGYERLYKTLASSENLSNFEFKSLKLNIDSINGKTFLKDKNLELDSPTLFPNKLKSEPKASLKGSQRKSVIAPRFSVHEDVIRSVIERNGKMTKHHINFEQLSQQISSKLQKNNNPNYTADTYATTDFTDHSKIGNDNAATISYYKLKEESHRSSKKSKSPKRPNQIYKKLEMKNKILEGKDKNKMKTSTGKDILKNFKKQSTVKEDFRKTYNSTIQSNLFSQTTAADTVKRETGMYNTLSSMSPRDSIDKINLNEENNKNRESKIF